MHSSVFLKHFSYIRSFRGFTTLALISMAALGMTAHPAAAQGLSGQLVNLAFGAGQTGPTASYVPYIGTNFGTQTVTPVGVTFNANTLTAFVTPNQIVFSPYFGGSTSFNSNIPFVGYRFVEVGASPQVITGISVDPTTTVGIDPNQLSFDGKDIYVNLRNVVFSPNTSLTVNFTSSPAVAPVPEASTTVSLGLLLTLSGLAVAVKRRKAPAA